MKLKYFLRGLGVGIVVTALILCVSYRNAKPEESVVEQAKKLGMVFPEKTSQPSKSPEVTTKPEETPAVSGSAVKEEATKAPEVTKEPTVTKKPESTVKPTKKPADTASKDTITFTVRGGLLSSSVAREMREQGVIEDDDAFDDYIEKNGYGKKIRAGTYKIPKNASYEEIAKIITRQD